MMFETTTASALEALRNALYKFKTYLLTRRVHSLSFLDEDLVHYRLPISQSL